MHQNSFLFNRSPDWKADLPSVRHSIPADVKSWVYEAGSLTQRLRCYYGKQFAVKILFHQWRPAYAGECKLLHIPHQQFNLSREVLLYANDEPLILARTILPNKTIKIAKRNLSHLGTRPLGEVIFSYPNLERLQLEVANISSERWSSSLQTKIPLPDSVWGRRTVYAIQKQPLLVSEFFLPGALKI